MIEARTERDESVARDASVGWLETNASAEGSRLANRTTRVASKRRVTETRSNRSSIAALATLVSLGIFIGYASIPAGVLLGILK